MADTAVTIASSKITVCSEQEKANSGFTHKFRVDYSDIASGTGSTDTVTMTLGTTPATFIVDKAAVNVTTAFAGTGAMTVIVGTTVDDDAFVASASILSAGIKQPTTGMNTTSNIANSTGVAAVPMKATFTNATSGSPSSLTAGSLDIYLSITNTARMP
jgi:hypothetical protein